MPGVHRLRLKGMSLPRFHNSTPQIAPFTLHLGLETIGTYCVPCRPRKKSAKIPDDELSGIPQGGATRELGWDGKVV
jgi:hypothetical protein